MNLKKLLNKKNKGFTLVEILVVILILAILIVALIPRISSAMDKAKETQIKTDFRTFSTATESVMREYSGFAGVPIQAEDGRTVSTVGEAFWSRGLEIAEEFTTKEGVDVDAASTVALIRAVNRYLESNYQFDDNVTQIDPATGIPDDSTPNPDFGRSAATDPWKQPYEIYFVARGAKANKQQSVGTDRIYITSSGKTNNTSFADYTMLCQYKGGEVRTATVGFAGESYNEEWDYVVGKSNGKSYVALNDLFEYDATVGHDTYFAIADTGAAELKTLFELGMAGNNFDRLYYATATTDTSAIQVETPSTVITATDPVDSFN